MADFDYQKMHDYVSADPEVTKLREKRISNYKKIDSLKTSANNHIEKMNGLYLAKRATMSNVQYESAGSDADEILETITGQCSECWDSDWQQAVEVVFDGQLSCSIAIANIAKQIYRLTEDIAIINGCVDKMEDELRKQFRTQFFKDQKATEEVEQ